MDDPNETEQRPSQIVISFPNGVSSTRAELQLSNVDTVQVEIAASFLQRVAADQFRQARQATNPMRPGPGILVPSTVPPRV